jgi:hypothetical protein
MAKLTEAQKRKNFEATVGSSENDMGPLPKGKGLELLTKEQYIKLPKIKPGSPAFSDLKSAPPGVDVDEKGNIEYKKKGGKITAANYDKEYGKIYRKAVKKMSSGGSVGSASKRADGIAVKGKTRGKIC